MNRTLEESLDVARDAALEAAKNHGTGPWVYSVTADGNPIHAPGEYSHINEQVTVYAMVNHDGDVVQAHRIPVSYTSPETCPCGMHYVRWETDPATWQPDPKVCDVCVSYDPIRDEHNRTHWIVAPVGMHGRDFIAMVKRGEAKWDESTNAELYSVDKWYVVLSEPAA